MVFFCILSTTTKRDLAMTIVMNPKRYAMLYAAFALIASGIAAHSHGLVYLWLAPVAFIGFVAFDYLHHKLPGRLQAFAPWLGLLAIFGAALLIMVLAREAHATNNAPEAHAPQATGAEPGLTPEEAARVFHLFQMELAKQAASGGKTFNQMLWLQAMQDCHAKGPQGPVTAESMTALGRCAENRLRDETADTAQSPGSDTPQQ
jgi:hypothetical protein